jgi:hypothetical protein
LPIFRRQTVWYAIGKGGTARHKKGHLMTFKKEGNQKVHIRGSVITRMETDDGRNVTGHL